MELTYYLLVGRTLISEFRDNKRKGIFDFSKKEIHPLIPSIGKLKNSGVYYWSIEYDCRESLTTVFRNFDEFIQGMVEHIQIPYYDIVVQIKTERTFSTAAIANKFMSFMDGIIYNQYLSSGKEITPFLEKRALQHMYEIGKVKSVGSSGYKLIMELCGSLLAPQLISLFTYFLKYIPHGAVKSLGSNRTSIINYIIKSNLDEDDSDDWDLDLEDAFWTAFGYYCYTINWHNIRYSWDNSFDGISTFIRTKPLVEYRFFEMLEEFYKKYASKYKQSKYDFYLHSPTSGGMKKDIELLKPFWDSKKGGY